MSEKKIQLNPVWQKRYKLAKFGVYTVFVLCLFLASYLILFPSASFIFSFKNPDSSKNTVVDPRSEKGELIRSGKVENGSQLIFDANPLGDFSEVELEFTLDGNSSDIGNGSVSTRRSYRSFFYPEGEKIDYPENTDLPRLLSANNSVFIASQGKIWPIADAITFSSMGWDWNDVVASNSEEIGNYEKQKLFTLKNPHPDGTIFSEKESGKYFLIENGEKREIGNIENFLPFTRTNPIIADEKGLEIKSRCELQSAFGFGKKYKCAIPIQEMRTLVGNDFRFEANFGNEVKITQISATFKKAFNLENLKSSVSILKNRTAANYGNNQ
jgi:hypothetical protein